MPALVEEATALAAQTGFEQSCIPEVGRLLRLLAAQVSAGIVGEIGTGCGVGAAWIASALNENVRFVTVELDKDRADAAARLFAGVPGVTALHGDWHVLKEHGPFKLLFADGGRAKEQDAEAVVEMIEIGGLVILDDMTPEDQWPEEWRGKTDPVRDFWLNDPRLVATELYTTPHSAVLLAVRQA